MSILFVVFPRAGYYLQEITNLKSKRMPFEIFCTTLENTFPSFFLSWSSRLCSSVCKTERMQDRELPALPHTNVQK
jgi:hypothetical protein